MPIALVREPIEPLDLRESFVPHEPPLACLVPDSSLRGLQVYTISLSHFRTARTVAEQSSATETSLLSALSFAQALVGVAAVPDCLS
jgi:hypothetical protein